MHKAALALALAGLTTPAFAQDTTTAPIMPDVSFDASLLANTQFATLDTDASGAISFEELALMVPDLTQDDFNAVDADGSGELSAEEYAALQPVDASGSSSN